MPIFLTSDPQLNTAMAGLAQAMFPDPATEMMAAYRRAGTLKLMQESQDLQQAAAARGDVSGRLSDPSFNLADPTNQRQLYGQLALAGPDYMRTGPQFVTAATGAAHPGMDPRALAQMQVSSGVVPYGGTQPGYELGQRTELGKAGIMAGAHVRGAQIAADQRNREFLATPHNVGENQIGYVPQAGQAMYGGADKLYGAGAGGGGLGMMARGPYQGTGMEAQDSNVILSYNQMQQRGEPIPEDMERNYAMAFFRQYGPKKELRAGPGGAVVEVPVQPQVPPGLAFPKYGPSVQGMPPMPIPAPGSPGAEPLAGGMGAPEAPAVPQAAPALTMPAGGQPEAPGSIPGAAPGVRTMVPGTADSKGLPEHQSRNLFFLDRMRLGDSAIRSTLGTKAPDLYGFAMAAPKEGLWSTLATNYLAPGSAKEFMTSAQLFMSGVLRKDTGAAAPFHEYPQYWIQFIPMPGDPPSVLNLKAQAREVAMASIEKGLPPDVILRSVQAQVGVMQAPPAVVQQLDSMSRSMTPASANPRADVDAMLGLGR
jgi:hypothetical protein